MTRAMKFDNYSKNQHVKVVIYLKKKPTAVLAEMVHFNNTRTYMF